MRQSILLTDYELKRLDDEIEELQKKRAKIAKERRDGGTKIIEVLPNCSFEVGSRSIRVEPKGFLKTIIPSYIGPQEEYVFVLNDAFQLDVNDYGCFLARTRGKLSTQDGLTFLKACGVKKEAIKLGDTMEDYYEKELSEARRIKTTLSAAIEGVFK